MRKTMIFLENKHLPGLNPIICGHRQCYGGHSVKSRIYDFFLLHYIKKGKGILYKDGDGREISAGQVFLLYPGEVTTYVADANDPWEYFWIGFDGALAERFRSLPDPVFKCQGKLFEEMMESISLNNTREEFLAGKIYELYSLIFENGSADVAVCRAKSYLEVYFREKVSIEQVAEAIGLSRCYLSQKFKDAYGISMSEYLINCRIKYACTLLEQGYLVAEAGSFCGYRDPYQFSKMFKKVNGISPKMYQQKKLQK